MNKIISFENLYQQDFSIIYISALSQTWLTGQSFSCINEPKQQHLLFHCYNCEADYTLKSGKVLHAAKGDIVYVPKGSEYVVTFLSHGESEANAVGANFQIADIDTFSVAFSDDIQIIRIQDSEYFHQLFTALSLCSVSIIWSPVKAKALLYEILADLSPFSKYSFTQTKHYQIISKGILYLEQDEKQEYSVEQIAQMCYVSETYFRKLFKLYAGTTPSTFRINHKITRAKMMLEYNKMNVKDVANQLGFNDQAYFCRLFKSKTGLSPIEYQKRNRTNNTYF